MHGIILCFCRIIFRASLNGIAVAAAVISWPCGDVLHLGASDCG